jgi:iron transport multicopper oxidase
MILQWYQDQAPALINYYQSDANEDDGGPEPIPNSALMQDTQNPQITVQPNKTYLIHVINIGSFVGSYLTLDRHEMTIVAVDGVYTEPQQANEIYITVAQRYSVLITTKNDANENFAILNTLDTGMFDSIPSWANPDVYGYLVYNSQQPLPPVTPLRDYDAYDDFNLVPNDHQEAFSNVDHQIMITMDFDDDDGVNR